MAERMYLDPLVYIAGAEIHSFTETETPIPPPTHAYGDLDGVDSPDTDVSITGNPLLRPSISSSLLS